MRKLAVLFVFGVAACANVSGQQRLAMGIEVPCRLAADDYQQLRGRTNAMERQEKAALQQSLQLVDAAIAMGGGVLEGPARVVRQSLIDRSNNNLRLAIETEADRACGFSAGSPPPALTPPAAPPRPAGPRTIQL